MKNSIINHFEAFSTPVLFIKNAPNQPTEIKINQKMQK